jgi:hypothetical protein
MKGRPPTITGILKRDGQLDFQLVDPLTALLPASCDEEQRKIAADVVEVRAQEGERGILDDDVAADAERVFLGRCMQLAGGADAQVEQLGTFGEQLSSSVFRGRDTAEVGLREACFEREGDAVARGTVLRGDVEAVIAADAP